MNESKENLVLSTLRSALEKIYGERLIGLHLYGSRARLSATNESDYDIIIVLDGIVDPSDERHRCADAIYEICWRYDVVVLCHFMSQERFCGEQSPYILNVRREGVAV